MQLATTSIHNRKCLNIKIINTIILLELIESHVVRMSVGVKKSTKRKVDMVWKLKMYTFQKCITKIFLARGFWEKWILNVHEYHSWRRVLKFGMNIPLYYMNMYTKNHFSSFFRLVTILSFLCIFKNFKCQLRQNEESQGHKILHAYP